jgi:diamine N-acetyltransferase
MLTIRSTSRGDLEQVVAVEGDLDTAVWLAETGRAWHEVALTDPDTEHLVAEDGPTNGLAGFVVLAGLRDGDGLVELRRMVLARSRRGTGAAEQLLAVAVRRAYELHGARGVWLDVKAHNARAIALYRSAGFVPTPGPRGALTEPDGTVTELLVMVHEAPRGPLP